MFGLTLIWQNHGYHGFWQKLHFEASTKNMHWTMPSPHGINSV